MYEELSASFCLVPELGQKTAPAGICYCPSELAIVHHVLDFQTLRDDRLAFVNQSLRDLVLEILAFASDFPINFCEASDRLASPSASFYLAGNLLVRFFQFPQFRISVINSLFPVLSDTAVPTMRTLLQKLPFPLPEEALLMQAADL